MTELLLHPKISEKLTGITTNPPHALLVLGPSGSGKHTLVRHVASKILAVQNIDFHPFTRFVDASDGDGISNVRQIRNFLSLKTTGTNPIRRIVVFENIDQLGFEAQNSMLKTLEEPPTDTVILLTAVSTGPVADTILSRVTQLQILPIAKDVSSRIKGYTPEELSKAHALSGGYAGSLITLLESDDNHHIKQGVAMAKVFLNNSTYERLCLVDTIVKDKQRIGQLLEGLERCLQAAIRTAKNNSINSLIKKLDYVDKTQQSLCKNTSSKLLLTALAMNL